MADLYLIAEGTIDSILHDITNLQRENVVKSKAEALAVIDYAADWCKRYIENSEHFGNTTAPGIPSRPNGWNKKTLAEARRLLATI